MTLSLAQLLVTRGGRRLLDRVSLTVAPGEVVALLGPNGAGKSTLLRAAAGEFAPDDGDVLLAGRPINRWPAGERARRLAVMPQASHLAFDFTAREVVAMGRHPHRDHESPPAATRAADAALAQGAVADLADRRHPSLSGGEQQRVQFARAIAQLMPSERPGWLLLDEPTASLDLAHQHMIAAALRGLADTGLGVMIVLHDLNLALAYADRAVLLADGRVVAVGPPHDILTPTTLSSVYGVPFARVGDARGRTWMLADPTASRG
jgi:iron complex transport system ATP-binding protein